MKKIINITENKTERRNMNTSNIVTVATKIDREEAKELKRIAKQKQIRFSSFIKQVLVAEIEKNKKDKQNV